LGAGGVGDFFGSFDGLATGDAFGLAFFWGLGLGTSLGA
jgi:hypothetical protein